MDGLADIRQLVRIYWSLLLGNIVEWYEFAVYGYLAPYLESNLFQNSAIVTWLGFTVTFLARPFGGVVLGMASDVVGRSTAVSISIIGMMIGTCGQGLLPTFASGSETAGAIGIALLVVLRLLQGVSAAGEISTISTYITEVSPTRSLGRAISMVAITGNLGFLLAKFVVFALCEILGEEAMNSWGWRLPFLLAIVPSLVATLGRRWLPESQEFLENNVRVQANPKEVEESGANPNPNEAEENGSGQQEASKETEASSTNSSKPWRPRLREVFRTHACNVAIGIFGAASFGISNYAGFVWMQSYLRENGLSPGSCMVVELCSRGLMLVFAYLAGWLADIRGVGWSTLAGGVLIALGGLPIFAVVAMYTTTLSLVVSAQVVLAAFNTLGGTVYFLFVAELFPTAVRGTAMGVTYNVGISLFGGLAPVLAEASVELHPLGPGFLLSAGGIFTTCTVVAALWLQHRGRTKLAHVRPQPYCRPLDTVQKEASECASTNNEVRA